MTKKLHTVQYYTKGGTVMAEKYAQIIPRNDTYEKWIQNNPVLARGEHGFALFNDGTWRCKIGDGKTPWNEMLWADTNLRVIDDEIYYFVEDDGWINTQISAKTGMAASSDHSNTTTKLKNARNIALSGDVSGNVNFDGSTDVTIDTTIADDSHFHDGRYYTETEMDAKLLNKSNVDHTHTKNQISDFPSAMPPTAHTHTTSQISDFPESMPPTAHTHEASDIIQDDTHRMVSDSNISSWDGIYEQSTNYTDKAISDLIDGAPTTLDTLKEIATAIQENKDVVTALDSAIGSKANQAEMDTHTGNNVIHISASERTAWDSKANLSDITTHTSDNSIHATAEEKLLWNTVSDKVDKVEGKGLSTNDFTDEDKKKLDDLVSGSGGSGDTGSGGSGSTGNGEDLSSLETVEKGSLVGAINEVFQYCNSFAPMGERVSLLEKMVFTDMDTYPYMILFDDLEGVVTEGVWNADLQCLEC